jgi:hypothetical protein
LGAALAALLLWAPGAPAVEPEERDVYVERAEPVCEANVRANKRIFKGAERKVKRGELKQASRHFFRAATAFAKTIRQLDAIAKPPERKVKLERWIDLLWDERNLIKKIGTALAAEKRRRAESFSVDLNRNSSRANNAVLPFGFDYCRIEPSRFKG